MCVCETESGGKDKLGCWLKFCLLPPLKTHDTSSTFTLSWFRLMALLLAFTTGQEKGKGGEKEEGRERKMNERLTRKGQGNDTVIHVKTKST